MSRLSARLAKLEVKPSALRIIILEMADDEDTTEFLRHRGIDQRKSALVVAIRKPASSGSRILSVDGVQSTDEMEAAAIERLRGPA